MISHIISVCFFINILLVILMIFTSRRKPETIISWFVIFTVLPIIGFIIYLILGEGLSVRTRKLIKNKKKYSEDYIKFINWQNINFDKIRQEKKEYIYADNIIKFVQNCDQGMFSLKNHVKVMLNGQEKLENLKKDLLNAKHSINMEYYIFANDNVGREIMNILCEKARSGVKVKLIYDSIGCLGTSRHFFKKLTKAGGQVSGFFPPFLGIRLINMKINYRNHRKIVVIDGRVAYTGGINIRDDHMGKCKRLSPWRDTHIRLEGKVVWDLQNIFFNDWRYSSKEKADPKKLVEQGYFDQSLIDYNAGEIGAQVITCGPETERRNIEDAYLKIIMSAKDKIYVQSPYFVPDDTFVHALIIAKQSGVDVKLMIPHNPDKRIVYAATLSYVKELVEAGIEVFAYKGFLHSKTLLADDTVVSIGTCNTDNRSFGLNFEITTLLYNKEFVKKNQRIFEKDIKNCIVIDKNYFKRKPILNKMAQAIFRLFSPLM